MHCDPLVSMVTQHLLLKIFISKLVQVEMPIELCKISRQLPRKCGNIEDFRWTVLCATDCSHADSPNIIFNVTYITMPSI